MKWLSAALTAALEALARAGWYRLSLDDDAWLPWGEEGELCVVQGWCPPSVMLERSFRSQVSLVGLREVGDWCGVVGWYGDDSDKPEDVFRAEVFAAFCDEAPPVVHGWARFWAEGEHPSMPDGGVTLSSSPKGAHVRATWLRLH